MTDTYLITGAAGFIGSNLCEALLKEGYQVVGMDNFATGFRKNIEPFMDNPGFTFIEGDIRNYEACEKALEGVDYVLHQGALGSVPRSIVDPMASNDTNVGGTVNMLFAAKEAGVKRFVYASSSAVYGDNPKLPKVEYRTGKALSPYAISKATDEVYARNFSELYGIETIGLRYFNVFGPRQDPNGAYAAVIPKWVIRLLKHEQPEIHGNPNYSRDFTYIGNVIQANLLAATQPSEKIREKQKEYYLSQGLPLGDDNHAIAEQLNIAFGGRTDLQTLFRALRQGLSVYDEKIADIEPRIGDYRPGDIPHSHADITKARMLLGYNPEYDAETGFLNACKWYWENMR